MVCRGGTHPTHSVSSFFSNVVVVVSLSFQYILVAPMISNKTRMKKVIFKSLNFAITSCSQTCSLQSFPRRLVGLITESSTVLFERQDIQFFLFL